MKTPPQRGTLASLTWLALVAPLVALVGLHALHARDLVGFLSGSCVGGDVATFLGLAYVLAWFTCVLIVPVIAIAAVLLRLRGMLASGMRSWRSSRAR